ncbi:MAG: UDP-N-acetylmuramoyl-tripeptide--D-alanyl-D-alanine ligase [Bacteroidota bacterium]
MTLEALHGEFMQSKGICTDTRQGAAGTLFFALKGERFDGNGFVADALEAGCRLAITETESLKGKRGIVYTASPLKLLQDLASFHRKSVSPEVIAITGSNGKTTTKELLSAILSKKYSVLATSGNLNNHIGVPLTLLSLKDEKMAVIEMGANHPGEIRMLAGIAAPDLGLITNVGKAHLEGFGSVAGVANAKGELFEYLANAGGTAIVDGQDSLLLEKASQTGVDTLVTGMKGDLRIDAKIIDQSPFLKVELEIEGKKLLVNTNLVGAYNLQNIRLAAAAGYSYGVPAEEIAAAVASYRPDNLRSQVVDGGKNRVILDTYNANPTSMREAVQGFFTYASGPTMVILGDMAELGDSGDAEHRELARWIGTLNFDRILLVGPIFHRIDEPSLAQDVFRDRIELEKYLASEKPEGYSILVKGSRVMELERLMKYLVPSTQYSVPISGH